MSNYKNNLKQVNLFLDFIKNQRKFSLHTVRAYKTDLLELIDYIGDQKPIVKVNKYDLHEHITMISRDLSSKTLSRKIASMKSFFKFLVNENLIPINVTKSIRVPKIDKKLPNHLTKKEMRDFFKKTMNGIEIKFRDLIIIDILYSTGIRVSECCSILKQDISLSNNTIKVLGKGNKNRLVVFGDQTKLNIEKYLSEESSNKSKFLFPSNYKTKINLNDRNITSRTIYNIVKKYIKLVSSNEKLGPHALRHSFATHLLQSGSDLMAIKDLLGHESLSSTQIYTHLDTERMKKIYKQSHPHAK